MTEGDNGGIAEKVIAGHDMCFGGLTSFPMLTIARYLYLEKFVTSPRGFTLVITILPAHLFPYNSGYNVIYWIFSLHSKFEYAYTYSEFEALVSIFSSILLSQLEILLQYSYTVDDKASNSMPRHAYEFCTVVNYFWCSTR